mgnify:CR=1 FL=1
MEMEEEAGHPAVSHFGGSRDALVPVLRTLYAQSGVFLIFISMVVAVFPTLV